LIDPLDDMRTVRDMGKIVVIDIWRVDRALVVEAWSQYRFAGKVWSSDNVELGGSV